MINKNKFIYTIAIATLVLFTSCVEEILDKKDLDSLDEVAFFDAPEEFEQAANKLYNDINDVRTDRAYAMDHGSDLHAFANADTYGQGIVAIPLADNAYWQGSYFSIRDANILLEKATQYAGDAAEIEEYVASAYFFRAFEYSVLLQRYGGVPIITRVLDLSSEEVTAPRNSRYEVVDQILDDLDAAISGLPSEATIAAANKGRITVEAAKAFKAWILLYEATWEKYVGTSTDGDGTSEGAGSAGSADNFSAYLTEAIALNREVIESGIFELWNYNNDPLINNRSNYYLFNLEGADSNPLGLDKTSNKEFIFYTVFDQILGNTAISQNAVGRLGPNRKMMDLFLSIDGLPIDQSPLFGGYDEPDDEYASRDYRLESYFRRASTNEIPTLGQIMLTGITSTGSGSGSTNLKFVSNGYPYNTQETSNGANWPIIRLATVYLNLAEAIYELNGSITDAELNETINLTKARAGLPALTNAFAATNGMDVLEEIRRERAIELYGENSRFHDLKRWGIAEQELNQSILGPVIEGTSFENNFALYNPTAYPEGEEVVDTGVGPRRAVVLNGTSGRNFTRDYYLWPIPTNQLQLNTNLVQNAGY